MINLAELKVAASQVLGVKPDERIDVEGLINDAGRYLFTVHKWRWRDRPATPLSYIAPITLTAATYTESTKTITKTGAVASYTYRGNEQIEITGGDNATQGFYRIASRTSADAIVLAQSIGSAADGDTDIAAEITFPYCVLPSDFGEGEIVSVAVNSNSFQKAMPESLSTIRRMREDQWLTEYHMYYAPVWPSQLSTSVAMPGPLLEIYPTPAAAEQSPLTLTYKAGWVVLEDEDAVANLPSGYEYILKRLVKAFAHEALTHSNEDVIAVRASPELMDLKKADGGTQGNLGMITGGAIRSRRGYYEQWPTVNNPGA